MKKNIQYLKFLLNQEMFNEILSRRTIVFLHIYKVGGSSFWHSLVKSLNNNTEVDFGISDSYHESLNLAGSNFEGIHNRTLLFIQERFLKSNKKRHVMHHHNNQGFLSQILPGAGYIVMIRDPEARLRSAFRHVMKTAANKVVDPVENRVITYDFISNPLEFFGKPLSSGLNHYFVNLFNFCVAPLDPPPSYVINFIRQNFYFFTLEDFRSNSHKIKLIEKKLSISCIENFHYEGTTTDSKFDKDLDFLLTNNKDFSRKWNEFLNAEISWHKALGLDI
jgi:hypothetical protein